MPPPTTWYCGHCGMGPMKIANDTHCYQCYKAKDYYARLEDTDGAHLNTRDHHISHRSFSISTFGTHHVQLPKQTIDSPEEYSPCLHRPLPIEAGIDTSPQFQSPSSDFWFCCHCKDGPKLFATQIRCVNCGHDVCSECPTK